MQWMAQTEGSWLRKRWPAGMDLISGKRHVCIHGQTIGIDDVSGRWTMRGRHAC